MKWPSICSRLSLVLLSLGPQELSGPSTKTMVHPMSIWCFYQSDETEVSGGLIGEGGLEQG